MVAAGKAGLARLVELTRFLRVIGFERALGRLSDEHQYLLMLQYRERHSFETIAQLTGFSIRALAATLDRLDLL
jgi:DNA-directed RNA polymerase specialized sigma24 family protein